jgi:diguanylate cyclase (GGDEF)-like protein
MTWNARDRRELEVLHRVALALSHSLAFSDVMDALALELTLAIERACECTISVWRPDDDALEVASVYLIDGGISEQARGERYPLADFPASRELLESGTGHVEQRVSDPGFGPRVRRLLDDWGWRTWLSLPLTAGDSAVGLVELVDYRSARRWSKRDVQFCETIASQAALAIRNAQMYEDLRRLVNRDPLTGLLNHRAFYERLEQELSRARRDGPPPVVMMVDLDDFKSLNDSRGHLAGDEALRRTGEALRSVCRAADVAARLGGDEFALILHGCADPDATARRVLAAVDRRAGVGASIGVAMASEASISTMQQADRSLLSAKQAGKRTFQIAS